MSKELVESVALKHSLPPELASRLKGDTREELEADAASLARFANTTPEIDPDNVRGGTDPNDDPDAFDAKAELAKIRRRR